MNKTIQAQKAAKRLEDIESRLGDIEQSQLLIIEMLKNMETAKQKERRIAALPSIAVNGEEVPAILEVVRSAPLGRVGDYELKEVQND